MIKTIMGERISDIKCAIDGVDKTGSIGIAYYNYGFDNLSRGGDDEGLYYFAQIMYKIFNLNVEEIIIVFHVLFIGFGFLIFCVGWFLFLKKRLSKFISVVVTLILTCLVYKVGDVYIVFYFMSSFIPIFLYLMNNNKVISIILALFILSAFSAISNSIRSYSFVPTILFIVVYLIINSKISKRYFYIFFIVATLLFANILHTIYEKSVNYNLLELNQNANLNTKHAFWHSVYVGLGYVDNEYIPRYLDEVAMQKVNSIDPSIKYLSKEYEGILKNETFKFIKEHKVITIQNFGAKLGVMFLYFLIFSNIGFYCFCASSNKKKKEFLVPCLCALCFNSIFGFLVIPSIEYLIGFISFSVIFAIYYIDNYINEKGFST